MKEKKSMCEWVGESEYLIQYHDEEWGNPVHDDRMLFEMLCLEGAQAGLSWLTVLRKRARYKSLFYNFDIAKVAGLSDNTLESFLSDKGIIRNRLKVLSVRKNAQASIAIIETHGTLSEYLWQFTGGTTLKHRHQSFREMPTSTKESDAMSKDLKKRGFSFVGTTICYSFMQAVGMVNDHSTHCWKYNM